MFRLKEGYEVFFSCPKCGNKGKISGSIYPFYNDWGKVLLRCNKCNGEITLFLLNPDELYLKDDSFVKINVLAPNVDDRREEEHCLELATDILFLLRREEIPFLKGAWKVLPKYEKGSKEIYCCPICKSGLEQTIYSDIEQNIDAINREYLRCYNLYVKGGYCNPRYIVVKSEIKCEKCGKKVDYIVYSEFNGRGESYHSKDFLIAAIGPKELFNVSGIYSREECKSILSKFILRWRLLSSKIIVVSPFLGVEKKYYKNEEKFVELLDWLMTITDEKKTELILRRSEYKKIQDLLNVYLEKRIGKGIDICNQRVGKGIFELLEFYGLLNPLILNIRSTRPLFHAKFYAGVLQYREGCKVEVLVGSYNIHDSSKSLENLILLEYTLSDFNEKYLKPLKVKKLESCDFDVEVLKIIKSNGTMKGKRYRLRSVEDIW